jgi:hypothetical protein
MLAKGKHSFLADKANLIQELTMYQITVKGYCATLTTKELIALSQCVANEFVKETFGKTAQVLEGVDEAIEVLENAYYDDDCYQVVKL